MMKKIFAALALLLIIGGAIGGFIAYNTVWKPNVKTTKGKSVFIKIPTGGNFDDVALALDSILIDKNSFEHVAELKKYPQKVKAGRYEIKNGWNNNQVVNLLRSGNQTALNFTFNNIRIKEELASRVGEVLEADSTELLHLLNDEAFMKKYGVNKATTLCLFLPNTYQFFWNTSAEQFVERMYKEYQKYWTAARKEKAREIGLDIHEVCTLAAIVQSETSKNDEKPRVAGVYVNRLERGMALEADPTLIFALGDFTIKRVLNVHKEIDSPYNTYKNAGLPPGPIRLPSPASLNSVLNHETHDYIFFCAKEDFSGYHNFATNLRQHNINARKYQRELNRKKIYR